MLMPWKGQRGKGRSTNGRPSSKAESRTPGSPHPQNFSDETPSSAGFEPRSMRNVAKALAQELGPRGIRVNSVSPGPVANDLWLGEHGVAATIGAANSVDPKMVRVQAIAAMPTGRFTTPEEVATLVALGRSCPQSWGRGVCRGACARGGCDRAPEGARARVTGSRAVTALRCRHAARAGWRGEVELEPG
jgi:Enoyl-(Acyl carrier protein) reductase